MDFFMWKTVGPLLVDNGTKTLRQLQVEDEEEERFRAELQKAYSQSLGKILLSSIHINLLFLC
jgi:hypothetical protein